MSRIGLQKEWPESGDKHHTKKRATKKCMGKKSRETSSETFSHTRQPEKAAFQSRTLFDVRNNRTKNGNVPETFRKRSGNVPGKGITAHWRFTVRDLASMIQTKILKRCLDLRSRILGGEQNTQVSPE